MLQIQEEPEEQQVSCHGNDDNRQDGSPATAGSIPGSGVEAPGSGGSGTGGSGAGDRDPLLSRGSSRNRIVSQAEVECNMSRVSVTLVRGIIIQNKLYLLSHVVEFSK